MIDDSASYRYRTGLGAEAAEDQARGDEALDDGALDDQAGGEGAEAYPGTT